MKPDHRTFDDYLRVEETIIFKTALDEPAPQYRDGPIISYKASFGSTPYDTLNIVKAPLGKITGFLGGPDDNHIIGDGFGQVVLMGGPGNDRIVLPTNGFKVDRGYGDNPVPHNPGTGIDWMDGGGGDVMKSGKGEGDIDVWLRKGWGMPEGDKYQIHGPGSIDHPTQIQANWRNDGVLFAGGEVKVIKVEWGDVFFAKDLAVINKLWVQNLSDNPITANQTAIFLLEIKPREDGDPGGRDGDMKAAVAKFDGARPGFDDAQDWLDGTGMIIEDNPRDVFAEWQAASSHADDFLF